MREMSGRKCAYRREIIRQPRRACRCVIAFFSLIGPQIIKENFCIPELEMRVARYRFQAMFED
jgi:hypothetical protein